MSDSVRPQRRQPTRLPHPWDSPGKNTGVGCHFLLQCMKVKSESEVAQSCPTLCDPMDCSLPGSSIHGIFQARVLDWGAIVFSDLLFIICPICSVLSATFISVLSVHPPSNDLCSMFSLQFKIQLRMTYFGSFTYNVSLVSFNLEQLPGARRHLKENSQKVIRHHPPRGKRWAGKRSEWSWRLPCKIH